MSPKHRRWWPWLSVSALLLLSASAVMWQSKRQQQHGSVQHSQLRQLDRTVAKLAKAQRQEVSVRLASLSVPTLALSALSLHQRLNQLSHQYSHDDTRVRVSLTRGQPLDESLPDTEWVSLALEARVPDWSVWQQLWQDLQSITAGQLQVTRCEFDWGAAALSGRCQLQLLLITEADENEPSHRSP